MKNLFYLLIKYIMNPPYLIYLSVKNEDGNPEVYIDY